MKSKYALFFVLSLLFLSACSTSHYVNLTFYPKELRKSLSKNQIAWLKEQNAEWYNYPPNNNCGRNSNAKYFEAPVNKGMIVTVNNDTIKGLVKLWLESRLYQDTVKNYILILPKGNSLNKGILHVDALKVNFLRIYPFDSLNTDYFEELVNLLNKSINYKLFRDNCYPYSGHFFCDSWFWKLEGQKAGISIYYDSYFFNETKYEMGRMIMVNGNKATQLYGWWPYTWHKRETLILKFINKRYNQHFKKDYFKDEKAEIDYILDKESESK